MRGPAVCESDKLMGASPCGLEVGGGVRGTISLSLSLLCLSLSLSLSLSLFELKHMQPPHGAAWAISEYI